MDALLTPAASLASLFVAAFLAATLVPLSSEAALFAVLKWHGDMAMAAIGIATLGNTPGMSYKELGDKTLITKGTLTGVIER